VILGGSCALLYSIRCVHEHVAGMGGVGSYCQQRVLYVRTDFQKILQMELCLTPADIDS